MDSDEVNSAKKKNKKSQYRLGLGLSWCRYCAGTSRTYGFTFTLVFGTGLAGM
jgi:hypothetical protein